MLNQSQTPSGLINSTMWGKTLSYLRRNNTTFRLQTDVLILKPLGQRYGPKLPTAQTWTLSHARQGKFGRFLLFSFFPPLTHLLSTGGTLAGVTRFLKEVSDGRVRCILADPPGSVLYSLKRSGVLERTGDGSITEGLYIYIIFPITTTLLLNSSKQI